MWRTTGRRILHSSTPCNVRSRAVAIVSFSSDSNRPRDGRSRRSPPHTPPSQQVHVTAKPLRPDQEAIRSMQHALHQLQRDMERSGPDRTDVCPVWLDHPSTARDDTPRRDWYARAVEMAHTLQSLIDRKVLQPSNQHRHEFSVLTERLLRVFSTIGPMEPAAEPPTESPRDAPLYDYRDVLQLIHKHGLELTHAHCHAALQLAARHGRWVEAADVYRHQTDPDVAGYLPVSAATSMHDFTVTGLYSTARAALATGMLPVESVLDGVTNLTLVSPSDSETYTLAAGVALGHAGEWDALRNYLKSSYKASQLGQPLVAATMHACILCHRYNEALELFDELLTGELASASEWQWSGGQDRLHPACRDLALRALGGIARDEPSDEVRRRALELYRDARNDESKVSVEALCAVLTCCENDWEMVTDLFLSVLDTSPTLWLVVGDECQSHQAMNQHQPALQDLVPHLGLVIDIVMKSCNASQKYGAALLCWRLFDTSIGSLVATPYQSLVGSSRDATSHHSPLIQSILPTLCAVRNNDLLSTIMVSLCGVQLFREAMHLYHAVEWVTPRNPMTRQPHDVYSYAESLQATSGSALYQSWETIHRHIHRLTASISSIVSSNEALSQADMQLLSSALAMAIRECSAASAPETGVLLGQWVERMPLQRPPGATAVFTVTDDELVALSLPLTDSLLSAAIEALALCGKVHQSENLVQSQLRTERDPSDWRLSYHEAVKLLFSQGQSEDGQALVRTIVSSGGTPALYCSAARNLISSGNWRPVLDLYRQSLTSGCTSEELSILAMEAIAASGRIGQKDSQFPLLRSVISETAKTLGTTPAAWIESNYWKLKRILGFSVARLIMGWDDYKRCRLDELDLAVETLEKRSNAGLTAKSAVLFSIVQAAANFEQYQVPFNATGLPKVPRDKDAWISILDKTIQEAKETRLMAEPNFILEIAVAFYRLGCHSECLEVVNDALARGLRLNNATLECAMKAAQNTDLHASATDIQMMLQS